SRRHRIRRAEHAAGLGGGTRRRDPGGPRQVPSGAARRDREVRRPRLMATRSELLLAFYGDDFTGSTDAMEALAVSGLRTVLFLSTPKPDFLQQKFPDLRCMGVAGTSRAMSPAEMDAQLAPVLRELWTLGAPLTHYKVCSTFDS